MIPEKDEDYQCPNNWRSCTCSRCEEMRMEYADYKYDKTRDDELTEHKSLDDLERQAYGNGVE